MRVGSTDPMSASDQLPIADFLSMLRDSGEQLVEASPTGWELTALDSNANPTQITEVMNLPEGKHVFPNVRVACELVSIRGWQVGQFTTTAGAPNRGAIFTYALETICHIEEDFTITLTGVNGGDPIGGYRAILQLMHDVDDIVWRTWQANLVTNDTKVADLNG